ncbi:MAG: ornithine carbamoyltransferase [Deltaproteobacteria bacterium]|nr:ornithine carbamoyltransferase [Deltaproteobacteria bacterium]
MPAAITIQNRSAPSRAKQLKRDLLTLTEFTPRELAALLELASKIKKSPRKYARALSGQTLAMIFHKSSTRTRVSFEVAMYQLGGHALFLSGSEIQLNRGETIADTARVLSRYAQGIMIRTFGHAVVEELAAAASVPVINGLTDRHHPCQILADLLTLKERHGRLKGLKLVYVGDGNNVVHSLLIGTALAGIHFKVICPEGYLPDPVLVDYAAREGKRQGASVEISHKLSIRGADAVYTDAWTSMGQEAEMAVRLKAFQGYGVTKELMLESPSAVFLHCLPAHRGEEVEDEVIDSPRSAVWDQAENRLHVQKAVLLELLKGRTK